MINEKKIRELIDSHLIGTDRFVVALKISSSNKIEIALDGLTNIGITDCVQLSRAIEGGLNREEEDFELMVSSVGIEEPFILEKQYVKNIGRNIMVKKNDGTEIVALLTGFSSEGEVFVEQTRRQAKKIGKGKETVTEKITIPLSEIKETKIVLSFK